MSFVNDSAVRSRKALRLSTDIMTAFFSRNTVSLDVLPNLIRTIHRVPVGLDKPRSIVLLERFLFRRAV